MVDSGLFGPWGRIILIVIVATVVLFVLLITACFLTPGCIGYECTRRCKKKSTKVPSRSGGQTNENVKLNGVSYRSWRLGSLYENDNNGTISENVEFQTNSVNSMSGQFESIETSSMVNLIHIEKRKSDKKEKIFPTELTLSLQYLPPCDDITGKFVVGIEAVSSLPPKQYNCTIEPYVALNIVKQSWSHRKQMKLHSFRTRGIRHTANPIYRETFVVANAKPHEVKEWILDIIAYDHDRYANHTELCSLKMAVKDVKIIFKSPEKHVFNYRMKPSCQEFGKILLGVSYLPTAQRLTINIMELRNIKALKFVPNLNEFYPYVRVLMLNGKTGKKLKKRKTRTLHAVAQPEFNETLTFDVAYDQLDSVQFLIVLCSRVSLKNEPTSNNENPSDSEDSSVNSYKKTDDIFIGKVALGKGVRGSIERLHWFLILQSPRKLVNIWHTLK
ncbi:synaptotagmin-1-like isoform X1 [Polistes fuscatus]|uniref:synaptotagmin-1-like isoform X1 n=1 Tax=Polistes fuscatus TaxID=30207 RepID=UPI001CA8811A|nr:synaptotagmin-1-like isoform X1 [Polistes fuscatus]XP_043495008.1 synaptotagmin-1-like isoform X1 [Polistes fuscatus]XP_043495010.1 synaptotagmin-1-like isoform X1 [Polistes fuscatus]XP_043495011.1 synaptotagmin-1-like isoform X1 [Polistes fuscatus]XP_043495012.1 synaptotagmin-1-like isoform X1 [Polistes fuscatus]